jgi:hypothetical protein
MWLRLVCMLCIDEFIRTARDYPNNAPLMGPGFDSQNTKYIVGVKENQRTRTRAGDVSTE